MWLCFFHRLLQRGGLFLAKSQARRKEIAIRLSLGATNWRILRQLLAEAFLLGLLGAFLGVCLAYSLAPALVRLLPVLRDAESQFALMPVIDLSPDWRILVFVVVACLLSGMLFGVLPALAALRVDLNSELRQVAGAKMLGLPVYASSILVGLQVMFTVVLVSASGLMIRTYWNLLHANPGFDGGHIVALRVSPITAGYKNEQLRSYYQQLLQNVRALPQIRDASLVSRGLMRGKGFGGTVCATGQTLPPRTFLNTSLNLVSPGYFDTMGIRLIEGRDLRFDDGDAKKPFPVVVDESFAHTFFPGQDVIGRTFATGTDGRVPPDSRIVGLVSSAKYRSLREVPPSTLYAHPAWTNGLAGILNLYVRTYGEPQSVVSEVRQAVRATDPHVPIIEVTTMRAEVRNSLWQERLVLVMTTFFGTAGLLLASIGLYGALTQAVVQNTRDIGIRMALGARMRHIISAVCLPQLLVVLVAVLAGLTLSAALLRVTTALLYGLTPFDPISYFFALGLILTTALLAAFAPISYAVKVDPASVLRAEYQLVMRLRASIQTATLKQRKT